MNAAKNKDVMEAVLPRLDNLDSDRESGQHCIGMFRNEPLGLKGPDRYA